MKVAVGTINPNRSTGKLEKRLIAGALKYVGTWADSLIGKGSSVGNLEIGAVSISLHIPLAGVTNGTMSEDKASRYIAHTLWPHIAPEILEELTEPFLVGFGKSLWEDVLSGAARDRIFAYTEGLGEGLYAAAEGLVTLIAHPIDSAEAIYDAATHWEQIAPLVDAKLKEYWRACGEDPEKFAKMTGHLFGQILAMMTGPQAAAGGIRLTTAQASKLKVLLNSKMTSVVKKLPKKPPANLAEAVEVLVNRPMPAAVQAQLKAHYKRIDKLRDQLATLRAQVRATDPKLTPEQITSIKNAENLMARARMEKSGTVRGTHGGNAGTNSVSIAETNFTKADQMVRAWAESGEPLTVARIQEINKTLGTGLQHNGGAPGATRVANMDVSAGGNFMRTYVEGANVDKALVDFVSWYETAAAGNMHTVELAAQAYQRLISIHPFWDANGRTCRMVMDWILQKQGLPPAVLDDVNVAVFGGHVLYNQMDQVVSASKAAEAVAAGVERSLMQLQAAAK